MCNAGCGVCPFAGRQVKFWTFVKQVEVEAGGTVYFWYYITLLYIKLQSNTAYHFAVRTLPALYGPNMAYYVAYSKDSNSDSMDIGKCDVPL
jgi:hypothetical protein